MSWLDLNAPGMFSCFGFLSLHLASSYIGRLCKDVQVPHRVTKLIRMMIGSGLCFVVFHYLIDETSRRMVSNLLMMTSIMTSMMMIE